ncbi:MAG: lytic transglycosylase domain-containing protein [Nanoarchaeota archaeon]|nr:lytic transglycosylase domain-containing protein [Nanoarchaeota archaeon]MBU0962417.1 lytic transglycosylase domain-containing protein [Nanoarchaeota archaeon]
MRWRKLFYTGIGLAALASCATFLSSKKVEEKQVVYENAPQKVECRSYYIIKGNEKPKISINPACVIHEGELERKVDEYQKPAVKKVNIENKVIKEKPARKSTSNNLELSRREIQNLIIKTANYYGVDPAFALAIADAESDFNPYAVSRTGAVGIMQLMPETARGYGLEVPKYEMDIIKSKNGKEKKISGCRKGKEDKCNFDNKKDGFDERFDPVKNIDRGVRYLCDLNKGLKKYDLASQENVTKSYIMGGNNFLRKIRKGKRLSREVISYNSEVNKNYKYYKDKI